MNVTSNADIVCTITNTRETGKLEVVKDLNPSGDPGQFNLQIDGNTDRRRVNVGDGGTTGEQTLNTGTHNVGETAGTGTDLADYQKSISCVDTANGNAAVASTSGDSAGPLDVSVTSGSDIVCTITNTRETGKLEVVKDLSPSGDPGKFNLQIDGSTDRGARTWATAGSTGEETAQHRHPQRRRDRRHRHRPGRLPEVDQLRGHRQRQRGRGSTTGDSAGPLNVQRHDGSDIVCTITNTRETGKLEVVKDLIPSGDPGRSTSRSTAVAERRLATNVGDGGTTSEQTLNTGTHNVGETAGTGTDLADYQKSISCVDTANGNAAVASTTGDSAGPLNVSVTSGSDIVCTITNTRETGKLEVVKDLSPPATPGSSTSRSTASPTARRPERGRRRHRPASRPSTPAPTRSARPPAPAPTSTTTRSRSAASTPPTATRPWLDVGDSGGPLNVSVTTGADIVCTITNTRETGKLEVVKDLSPTATPGVQPPDRRQHRPGRRERGRRRLDRRGDRQHRPPHGRRGRRHQHRPRRLPEVDQLRGHRQRRRGRGSTTARQRGPAERQRHDRRRHRLHDHEHPRDGQARGGPRT